MLFFLRYSALSKVCIAFYEHKYTRAYSILLSFFANISQPFPLACVCVYVSTFCHVYYIVLPSFSLHCLANPLFSRRTCKIKNSCTIPRTNDLFRVRSFSFARFVFLHSTPSRVRLVPYFNQIPYASAEIANFSIYFKCQSVHFTRARGE